MVDALGSGPSGGNTVEVRVLFWAPIFKLQDQFGASSLTQEARALGDPPLPHFPHDLLGEGRFVAPSAGGDSF